VFSSAVPADAAGVRRRSGYKSEARTRPGLNRTAREVGARVYELRTEHGLTQEELGVRAGIDSKHVQKLEHGHANATLATLASVAEALQVPLRALLDPPAPETLSKPRRRGRPSKA
jgi:XRE family transcriptional regulator, regulator of sulfur utilization